jgi:hypothetical protein
VQPPDVSKSAPSAARCRRRRAGRSGRVALGFTFLALAVAWYLAARFAPSLLNVSERVVVLGLVLLLCAAGLVVMSSRWFAHRVVGRATPGTLGAIRFWVCFIAAVMTYLERTGSLPSLPASDRRPGGVIDFIYGPLGLDALAHSHTALAALKALTIAVLLAAAVGWKTRITLPLGAILWLILAGVVRAYLRFTHNGLIPFYLIVMLCFTPCWHGLSVDRLIRLWRGERVPPANRKRAVYAWSRLAAWVVLALPYAMAGMSKIRYGTWMWWAPENMQHILYRGAFRPHDRPYDWVLALMDFPPWIFAIMGIATLITENGMILVPFWRPARRVMPIFTVGMHVAIYLLQRIRFWDMMVLLAIYYDWTKARQWVGRRVAAVFGTVRIMFDTANPKHARVVRVAKDIDLLELLVPVAATVDRMRWERQRPNVSRTTPIVNPSSPPPRPARPRHWPAFAAPLAIVVIHAAVLGWWAMSVEWFPFTSMRMYAEYNGTGVVEYYRVFQTDENGVTRPAYMEKLSRSAGVFHLTLWHAFRDPVMQQRCINLLHFAGHDWNTRAPAGQRVVALEIKKYRWDFMRDRDNPRRGQVINELRVPIQMDSTATAGVAVRSPTSPSGPIAERDP